MVIGVHVHTDLVYYTCSALRVHTTRVLVSVEYCSITLQRRAFGLETENLARVRYAVPRGLCKTRRVL